MSPGGRRRPAVDAKDRLRRVIVGLVARVNVGDIVIRHHWTGDRVMLHSFRHKGYWYHGKRREHDVMLGFGRIVEPSDVVIEAGGHIGYVSLWLAALAAHGQCHVFEPSSENREYLLVNSATRRNIVVVPMGLAADEKTMQLTLDPLTGQNSSFVRNFSLKKQAANAFGRPRPIRTEDVAVTTVDAYARRAALHPHVIKIDVEGFEHEVIKGAAETIRRDQPVLMVELHGRYAEPVWEFLCAAGYQAFTPNGDKVNEPLEATPNTFFFPLGSARAERFLADRFSTGAAPGAGRRRLLSSTEQGRSRKQMDQSRTGAPPF